MNAPTTIKLTKAERKGLEEVRDHGWCARTEPVVDNLVDRGLMERDWSRGLDPHRLTPDGKRAIGIDPEARPL